MYLPVIVLSFVISLSVISAIPAATSENAPALVTPVTIKKVKANPQATNKSKLATVTPTTNGKVSGNPQATGQSLLATVTPPTNKNVNATPQVTSESTTTVTPATGEKVTVAPQATYESTTATVTPSTNEKVSATPQATYEGTTTVTPATSEKVTATPQATYESTPATVTPATDEKLVAHGILSLAVDLVQKLHHATKDENLILSPLSIYAALSLVYLGADGSTRDEICKVLKSPTDNNEIEKFHKSLGNLLNSIQYRPERVLAEVTIANGLFVKKELDLKPLFLNQSIEFYKSEIEKVDFTKKEEAFALINKWVSEKTQGRIPQIFQEPLDPDTLTILASSLYFNGRWSEHFYTGKTKNETFFTGVENITTPMMHNEDAIPHVKNPDLQFEAITLEYDGKDFSMGIILPYPNQPLSNLTQHLEAKHIKQVFDEENCISIDYKIPRMKFKSSFSLKDSLSALGMPQAFNVANFSKLIETIPVKIGDVKHAAEIEVDEDGTKASAITAIQLIPLSGKVVIDPVKFYVNRPFLLAIYHRPTSTVIFLGAVHKPIDSTV